MNWLHKILLMKFAARELYYHGTSVRNLSTILSQGLNMDYEPVFDENFRERDRSIDTYGGIYLTKNLMTAVSAGSHANQKFLGQAYADDHVLVVAQIERSTPSIWIDEDAMPSPVSAITLVFQGLAPNGWWYMNWANGGFEKIDEIAQKYVEIILNYYNANDIDPRFVENMLSIAKDIIVAHTNREIAISMEKDTWSSYKNQFPSFAEYSLVEMEQRYRAVMNLFASKAHRLTSFRNDSSFRQNIRAQEPITFRGASRIVVILRTHNNREYFDVTGKPRGYANEITVEYMSEDAIPAIEMFIKDWKQGIGEYFIVKSRDGEVFYDEFDEEIKHDLVTFE